MEGFLCSFSLTSTKECSCKLWPTPGIQTVILNPEANCTPAKALLDFSGLIVEKLTDYEVAVIFS